MKFIETTLKGAYIIEMERQNDERGFFARAFCKNEFSAIGLDSNIVQVNNSFSAKKGTLRGMHYQLDPKSEDKMVRCISGAVFDVIIDLRQGSDSYCHWIGIELNAENRKSLFVPKGFAHGYVSLVANTEILYMSTEFYSPIYERGIRWNDPLFKIDWLIEPLIISGKDRNHPDFNIENLLK